MALLKLPHFTEWTSFGTKGAEAPRAGRPPYVPLGSLAISFHFTLGIC